MPDGLGLGIYALALLRVAARIIERDQLVTGNTLLPDAGGEEGIRTQRSSNAKFCNGLSNGARHCHWRVDTSLGTPFNSKLPIGDDRLLIAKDTQVGCGGEATRVRTARPPSKHSFATFRAPCFVRSSNEERSPCPR